MSDLVYDSDEYHDDYLPDLHREGSLPDLVLSSSLGRETELFSSMDLTSTTPSHVYDVPTDIESEYFTTLDQVTTTCGLEGIRVSYEDHSKIYIPKISTSDNYRCSMVAVDKPIFYCIMLQVLSKPDHAFR